MRRLPSEYRPERDIASAASIYVFLFCSGLMTAASIIATLQDPILGSFGVLFFGAGLALAAADRRHRLDALTRARIAPFLGRLRRDDLDGYTWLLRVLARLDGRTPRARHRSRVALTMIGAHEPLLRGLFVHSRHGRLSVAVFATRLGRPGTGALVPALASLHPDGHVRQAAVAALGHRLQPASLPFLIERTVDWVPEVRAAAQSALRAQLCSRPDLLAPAQAAYLHIARRKHAPDVGRLLETARRQTAAGRH